MLFVQAFGGRSLWSKQACVQDYKLKKPESVPVQTKICQTCPTNCGSCFMIRFPNVLRCLLAVN